MAEELENCKDYIENRGLASFHADSLEKQGIIVDEYLTPSKDWKKMKYYNVNINETIKGNFKQHLSEKLPKATPIIDLEVKTEFRASGNEWDKLLSDYINLLKTNKATDEKKAAEVKEKKARAVKKIKEAEEKAANEAKEKAAIIKAKEAAKVARDEVAKTHRELMRIHVAEKLVGKLQNIYEGLKIIHAKFPLFGFMSDDADRKKIPKSYLWQGVADAIGFYEGKYIIVEFKVVSTGILSTILEYQQKAADLCGKHLHQCLIYARLLKLHMGLDYLPPSLIVVIDGSSGRQIYPPFFKSYPRECEDKLENFKWSEDEFPKKPPLKLHHDGTLFLEDTNGPIDTNKKLTEIFKDDATVKNLLDALGYESLEVTQI
ncbi:hypothetical protein ACROYT_G008807 [Oculina patagonica]